MRLYTQLRKKRLKATDLEEQQWEEEESSDILNKCGNRVSSKSAGSVVECKRNLKKMRARAKKASEGSPNHQRAPSKSLPSPRCSAAAVDVLRRALLFIQPREDAVVSPPHKASLYFAREEKKKLSYHRPWNASECINSVFQMNRFLLLSETAAHTSRYVHNILTESLQLANSC